MLSCYYGHALAAPQARKAYADLLGQITAEGNRPAGRYPLRGCTGADALAAYAALRLDHPEIFWFGREVQAYPRLFSGEVELTLTVLYTENQIFRIRRLLDARLQRFASQAAGCGAWERERRVYAALTADVRCADSGSDALDHSIVGPLLRGTGVCEGISSLLQLALSAAGIPCIRVLGWAQGERHSWNLAEIDGTCCQLDPTFEAAAQKAAGATPYFWFNLTAADMGRDHEIPGGLPPCTDGQYEYARRTGACCATPAEAVRRLAACFWRGETEAAARLCGAEGDITACTRTAMRLSPPGEYRFLYDVPRQAVLITKAQCAAFCR
jgi:hypothetical protein